MRRGKTNTDTDVCRREHFCWDTAELQGEGVKGKGEARRKEVLKGQTGKQMMGGIGRSQRARREGQEGQGEARRKKTRKN